MRDFHVRCWEEKRLRTIVVSGLALTDAVEKSLAIIGFAIGGRKIMLPQTRGSPQTINAIPRSWALPRCRNMDW
jgi:hypothetical protein